MSLVAYRVEDHVAVLTMNSGENRFNPDFLQSMFDALDEIEKQTDATVLVVTSGHEKIFSNGIDLDWLIPYVMEGNTSKTREFFYMLNELFERTLTCPFLTLAAINGHSFAGGAIWSCAFDFRFMRSDRGFFCFPEVDLGIPFLPGMLALLEKSIPLYMMNYMQYTGARLTAQECEKHHIVEKACHLDDLMQETMDFAKTINKKRAVIKEMKFRMNRNILRILQEEDPPYIDSGSLYYGQD